MKSQRLLWGVYAGFAGLMLLTLVWVSVMVINLEGAERGARAKAQQQEAVRLALWRMDSWFMTRLAQESARPYFEYQPFYPQTRAYTRLLYQIEPGDVMTPSPLLTFRSEFIRLHFQMSPDGSLSSPQAPVGEMRDLAGSDYLSAAAIDSNLAMLNHLSSLLGRDMVASCVAASEAEEMKVASMERALNRAVPKSDAAGAGLRPIVSDGMTAAKPSFRSSQAAPQEALSVQEFSKRKDAFQQNVDAAFEAQNVPLLHVDDESKEAIMVGSLAPVWLGSRSGKSNPELLFIRRVRVDDAEYFQGFLCNWPALATALLHEITDLVSSPVLTPNAGTPFYESGWGSRMATMPVSLSVGQVAVAPASVLTPVRVTIGVAWLAVLLGMVAVAATLKQSIVFGEKRSRFATAVTHELRTPLTTFRMYTEMLADGMIQDDGQRQAYLTTLKDESGRLASLVENVLSYARLEEGRRTGRIADIAIGDLMAQARPLLERRAADAGMTLDCESGVAPETIIRTDAEAYNQIVFNLVDNACKYARDAQDRSIQLRVGEESGRLSTLVCDHGAGITPAQARMIFEPFERGKFAASDKPGIGLGLALSRRLARDLGGDLICKPGHEGGACFELILPLAKGR